MMGDLFSSMNFFQHDPHPHPRIVTPKYGGLNEDNQFMVTMDVLQFAPEELKVTMTDNCLVIEGKHEEREDEHGYITRQFVRRYAIPEDVKQEEITCDISSDGVMTISAPRRTGELESNEKFIPITFTGRPAVIGNRTRANDGDEFVPIQMREEPPAA